MGKIVAESNVPYHKLTYQFVLFALLQLGSGYFGCWCFIIVSLPILKKVLGCPKNALQIIIVLMIYLSFSLAVY